MDVPNSVKLFINKLVPVSVMPEIMSFILNDNHPLNPLKCDIFVGTKQGELIEFKDRQVLKSLKLSHGTVPKEMFIYRNHKNIPYYFIWDINFLHIVSAHEEILSIIKVINDVNKFEVNDFCCTGEASVRIWFDGDPVAVELDEQFNTKLDECIVPMEDENEGAKFTNALKRKLREAKYHVAHNDEKLNEVLKFRHDISHTVYKGLIPGEDKQISFAGLSAETEEPWLRYCNRKLVIGVHLRNESQSKTIREINMIVLRGNISKNAYKTYLYEHRANIDLSYVQKSENIMELCSRAALVSVMNADLHEDIKVNVAVSYKIDGYINYLPMKEILIKTFEIVRGDYDVWKTNIGSDCGSIENLAISATSLKTCLKLTPLLTEKLEIENVISMFTGELGFTKIQTEGHSILTHATSPGHPLNGILISFENDNEHLYNCYSRSENQLIILIKLIYELVSLRIAVTTPDVILESLEQSDMLLETSNIVDHTMEDVTGQTEEVNKYGQSLDEQMLIVLQYFDDCIICMGKSSDQKILNLMSQKIDLKSPGLNKFNEFCNMLKSEISKGNKYI